MSAGEHVPALPSGESEDLGCRLGGDYVAQIRRALGDDIAIDKSSSSCKRWKLGAGKNQCRS
jgi:hypothetical protein